MSEAKNLQDQNLKNDPAVYSETYPIVQELTATSVSAFPPAEDLSGYEKKSQKRTAFTSFAERLASFLLKFILISSAAFATGAFLTINVLMDRIDHKSGWLKEVLQFIKETSKYLLK